MTPMTEPTKEPASSPRTRVLIEAPDAAVRWAEAAILKREGYEVTACGGPDDLADGTCPMVEGHGCRLAEDADVIVHGLPVRHAANRQVLAALRANDLADRVVVEVTSREEEQYADDLTGMATAGFPFTGRTLARAVAGVLRRHAS